ncbi:hypothetical protein MRY82_06035 [bacterium]|nr:hypothetical protein [bacterium]
MSSTSDKNNNVYEIVFWRNRQDVRSWIDVFSAYQLTIAKKKLDDLSSTLKSREQTKARQYAVEVFFIDQTIESYETIKQYITQLKRLGVYTLLVVDEGIKLDDVDAPSNWTLSIHADLNEIDNLCAYICHLLSIDQLNKTLTKVSGDYEEKAISYELNN